MIIRIKWRQKLWINTGNKVTVVCFLASELAFTLTHIPKNSPDSIVIPKQCYCERGAMAVTTTAAFQGQLVLKKPLAAASEAICRHYSCHRQHLGTAGL